MLSDVQRAMRRLDGLCDEPRPGVPRKITDADVERVIVKTLEETPKDATPAASSPAPILPQPAYRPTRLEKAHAAKWLPGRCHIVVSWSVIAVKLLIGLR
ncbi:hypothetical protein AB5J72_01365 [Streptomyces sp. CG1]|uniref:hypothetical protein n=1 Tax=Streptomyces sp. CG1 TaxID=1287523 RepID=UPI0034E21670